MLKSQPAGHRLGFLADVCHQGFFHRIYLAVALNLGHQIFGFGIINDARRLLVLQYALCDRFNEQFFPRGGVFLPANSIVEGE